MSWHDLAIKELEAEIKDRQDALAALKRLRAQRGRATEGEEVPRVDAHGPRKNGSKWAGPIDEVLARAEGFLAIPDIIERMKKDEDPFVGMTTDPAFVIRRALRRYQSSYGWRSRKKGKQVLWKKS